jgi:hypothetical protein
MSERLYRYRQLYAENINIYTNYNWSGQTGPITGWRQMVEARLSNKPTVFAFDEIGNTFDQRSFKEFPKDLLPVLTQCRKWGGGVQVLATAQRFSMVEVTWRRMAANIIECVGLLDSRLIRQRAYDGEEEYNGGQPRYSPMGDRDLRKTSWGYWFVATDKLRNTYDTYYVARRLAENGEAELPGWEAVAATEAADNVAHLSGLQQRQAVGLRSAPSRGRA